MSLGGSSHAVGSFTNYSQTVALTKENVMRVIVSDLLRIYPTGKIYWQRLVEIIGVDREYDNCNGGPQRMDKEALQRELKQLHAELQRIHTADPNDREMLGKLATDIRRILGQEEIEADHYKSLRERLREAVAQFEASHPSTTMLMRQLIDQLAYMGI
jgi:uncharacterized protein DUF4404